MRWLLSRLSPALALSICCSFAVAQLPGPSVPLQVVPEVVIPPGVTQEGLAKAVCSACHLFPAPELLDKQTWKLETLPRMMIRMGLAPESIAAHPEAELLKATGRFPSQPMVSPGIFDQIVAYYVSNAPPQPIPQSSRGEISIGLPQFELIRPKVRRSPPVTTLVKIQESERRVYLGDAQAKSLDWFSSAGERLGGLDLSNAPVSLAMGGDRAFVTMIGSFFPSEQPLAQLLELAKQGEGWRRNRVLLENQPRTVDAAFADFNADGRKDFALCVFGNVVGRFSWFEGKADGSFEEHLLIPKAGAVRCVVHDFNRDGRPDIAVLVAQETEALSIFENLGKGEFLQREIFRQHPLFGHTGFELIDFNKDGRMDFLVTNGDNGEYPSPTKRYHGVRLYSDLGTGEYKSLFFYPMNGAFKAVARDFDGDGDLDIAAVSFFPDYERSPEESFVYLENRGGTRFGAQSFRECISGRWLTMDVGDLDGDGDDDLVLGSNIRGPGKVPDFVKRDWEKEGPSFVILRNRLKASVTHDAATRQ